MTSLLGFECSIDKELPFSNEAEIFGVVLDLSKTGNGEVIIKNKESRTVDLAGNLDALIRERCVEPKRLPFFLVVLFS